MRERNDDANAAMGTLLALIHPDCNASSLHGLRRTLLLLCLSMTVAERTTIYAMHELSSMRAISLTIKSISTPFLRNGKL